MLEHLGTGFANALQFGPLLGIIAGVVLGYFFGAMPGLSASAGMALLVPLTYGMPPEVAISMLITLYAAAEYGSCVTAITVNTPGTPGAIAVVFDGYAFTRKGQPAKALGISIIASTIGAYFGYFVLIVFTEPVARFAITLGAAEYAALGIFALSIVAGMIGKSWVKGVIMALVGLMIATVGLDPLVGWPRYTFGQMSLFEGLSFVPILIGLCAISEALHLMEKPLNIRQKMREMSGALPTWAEITSIKMTYLRGSVIGTAIGIIPGAGAAIASLISYNEERRASKHPEKFGTGVLEGVAAPEAANNATVGGSLIPLLSLGIPGSNSTAILIGALMLQGIVPGPLLMSRHTDLVYTIFAALIIGAPIMLLVGLGLTRVWISVLKVPEAVLAPVILFIAVIGSYAYQNSFTDVIVAVTFGIIGLLMKRYDFPYAPLILAVVLGEMIEINARRALITSHGSFDIFVQRPISAALLLLTALAIVFPLVRMFRERRAIRRQDNS